MNRRNFLRNMFGVAAATTLPSEVWPFRKIFLPAKTLELPLTMSGVVIANQNRIDILDLSRWGITDMEHLGELLAGAYPALMPPMPDYGDFFGLSRSIYPGRLRPTRFVYRGSQFVPFSNEQKDLDAANAANGVVKQLELELEKTNREIVEAFDDVYFSQSQS